MKGLPFCLKSILGAANSDTAIDYVVAGHAIEYGGMTPALPTSAAGAPVYSSAGTVRQPDFGMQPACVSAGASCLPCSGSICSILQTLPHIHLCMVRNLAHVVGVIFPMSHMQ